MKRYRPDRNRQATTLELADLQRLQDRGVHVVLWRHLLSQSGADPQATVEEAYESLKKPRDIEGLDNIALGILHHVAECGGRQRGELIRKEFLLQTLLDVTDAMVQIVDRALLWPMPSSDQENMEHDALFDQTQLLQVDLVLPEGLAEQLEAMTPPPMERHDQHDIEGEVYEQTSLEMLELNVLHMCDALHAETLKLNKSGSPNKRSLSRFSTGLVLPGETQPTDSLDAQNLHHLDYVALLLALAKTLGFLHVSADSVTTDFEAMGDFFNQNVSRRNKVLEQALQNLKAWDEILSHTLPHSPQQDQDLDAQLSLTRTNGQWLIGARGYILSILRRAPLDGWMFEETLIDLCVQFDRDYVDSVLANHVELNARNYVHIFVTHMLAWTGIIEQGETNTGARIVRLTERGAALIQGQELPSSSESKCLIVQPNFEAMVFLDNTSTQTLFKLYQIGTRVGLADRVATFRLTSQSIQRGYSLGMSAEETISLLNTLGHTPLDQTVAFQLNDWERIWNQVTLYADGILLRHEDPDAFDLIVGQLKHEWRNDPVEIIRLSPGSAFVSQSDLGKLRKMMTHNPSIIIDYLGHIPPSFEFVDTMSFIVHPAHCDIITFGLLDTIAKKNQGESTRLAWHYDLDLDAIETRWPEDTLTHLLAFLHPRSMGGLPATQELKLRALLSRRKRVTIEDDWMVIHFEDELTAQLFANIPQVQEMNAFRLGSKAFGIDQTHRQAIDDLLDQLSIVPTS